MFTDFWNGLGAAISSIDLGQAITGAAPRDESPSNHGASPPLAAPPVGKVHDDVFVLEVRSYPDAY